MASVSHPLEAAGDEIRLGDASRQREILGHMAETAAPWDSIDLVRNVDGMRALEEEWRALEENGADTFNFFQSYDWSIGWTERFASRREQIAILVARRGTRASMIWPLMVLRVGPVRVLTWLGEPFPQYCGVLIDRDVDREAWLRSAWAMICSMPGVDAIQLRRVRQDDPVAPLLESEAKRLGEVQESCFVNLGRYDSYDDMIADLPSRRRRIRRKLQRNLEEAGELKLDVSYGGKAFADGIREAMFHKRNWLRQTGQVSRAIADRRLDDLLLSFDGAPQNGPRIAVGVLRCASKPIAYEVAFHYRGHHYLYLIAQDPDYVALSPSKVQIDLMQKRAIEAGMSCFDLLPPGDRYKYDLSDETVAVSDFGRARTIAGRIYIVYLARLRPTFKRLYLKWGASLFARLRGGSSTQEGQPQ